MPWSTHRTASSKRTGTRAWGRTRQAILERDSHQCTHTEHGTRCTEPADQVDHITPVGMGGTDTPDNLTSLCLPHHKAKIQTEARASRNSARRPAARHPGLIA